MSEESTGLSANAVAEGEEELPAAEPVASSPGKRNWLRRTYDWILHWAETPYGVPALFLLAFAESSFFPIPPDVLLIALAVSIPARSFRFAGVCSLGSVLGGICGYGIGRFLWWSEPGQYSGVAQFFFRAIPGFTEEVFQRIQSLYEQWNFWAVFSAGFSPIPYKVFTIAGGVFDISFPIFLLASALSRSARFFLVGGLIWKFGAPVRAFIERYFDKLAFLFVILLILGFLAVKYGVH